MKINLWLVGTIIITTLAGCMDVSSAPQPAVPVVGPVSIVEPTDAQMSCAQLWAESHNMDQDIANANAAMSQPANTTSVGDSVFRSIESAGVSSALSALGGVIPYAGAGSVVGSAALSGAAGNMQMQQATQAQIQAQNQVQRVSQAQTALSSAQQRKIYLASLMQQKHCGDTAAAQTQ